MLYDLQSKLLPQGLEKERNYNNITVVLFCSSSLLGKGVKDKGFLEMENMKEWSSRFCRSENSAIADLETMVFGWDFWRIEAYERRNEIYVV